MGLRHANPLKNRDVKLRLPKPPASFINVGRRLRRQSIYAPVAPTLCRVIYIGLV